MIQLTLLLLLSLSIRLIKIQDYLFFGFEQGRDLQIIQKIYQLQDFVLVGPGTGINGVFHGAWYYYLLAIPLGFFSGNPLSASILLVALGALVPLIVYFLARDIFQSNFWGLVAGIITIFSYEYILYSRWLSNVSPAPLFIALALLTIWKYSKNRSAKYFVLFISFSLFAVLFQMILAPQFLLLLILLFAFRLINPPSLKTWMLSIAASLVLLSPMLVFEIRNQNIISSSLLNFLFKSASESTNISSVLLTYLNQMNLHLQLSLINISKLYVRLVTFSLLLIALTIGQKKHLKQINFIILPILMTLPIIFISPGNPQYYVAVGFGWILLFTFSLKTFWETKELKAVTILMTAAFIYGVFISLNNLLTNKEVFFTTIQDDLNYKDQKAVLDYIHNDSNGQPYRFISFTIPSLQPQAWDYLKSFYYPQDSEENAKVIYIVIEKHVYPIWENKWIDDEGPTTLISENYFGKLRVQKRLRIEE